MAILYKLFVSPRTVFCVILGCFLWVSGPVFAQSNPYVVEGVTVDVSADNALNARNQAFEKAQQDAFMKLAAQFLPAEQLATLQPPPGGDISPMLQDYEVTKEKLSTKRYVGIYTFRFKEKAVQRYFGNTMAMAPQATPLTGAQQQAYINNPVPSQTTAPGSGTLLVLPFAQSGTKTILWSPYNGWMAAWRRGVNMSNQVLPIGDLMDVKDVGDEEATSYDPSRLYNIVSRYGASEAVMVVAVPDAHMAQVASDTMPVNGALKINIYRTDRRDGPEQTGQIALVASPGETRAEVFDRAVFLVQQTLTGSWKNNVYLEQQAQTETSTTPAGGPANTIEARVPFANMQEWSAAQRSLNRIPGITDIVLKSLSPREARVGIVYQGDADTLRLALQQAGMDLSQAPEPRSSGQYGFSPQPVYKLYLHPLAPQQLQQPSSLQKPSYPMVPPHAAESAYRPKPPPQRDSYNF